MGVPAPSRYSGGNSDDITEIDPGAAGRGIGVQRAPTGRGGRASGAMYIDKAEAGGSEGVEGASSCAGAATGSSYKSFSCGYVIAFS